MSGLGKCFILLLGSLGLSVMGSFAQMQPSPGGMTERGDSPRQIDGRLQSVSRPMSSSAANGQRVTPGVKVAQLFSLIEQLYVDADTVNMNRLSEFAIRRTLQELDPHSSYISRENARQMNEPLQGRFDGVGIGYTIYRDTLFVVSVTLNGPSCRAGIRIGDRLLSANGVPLYGKMLDRENLSTVLRGEQGSTLVLTVKRKGERGILSFNVIRGNIAIESVEAAYLVTPTVGYIRITRFAATTYEEFIKAVGRLQWQGMQDLIVDVCDNTGGLLDAAVKVADEMLPDKALIVYTEGDKQPRMDFRATAAGLFQEGRVVVMINESTASASEILAGAIQDWDRGTIVGRRSFGKGLVQRQISLQDGSMIRLSVARYHTPSGRVIQKPYMESAEAYKREAFSRDEEHERNYHPMDTTSYWTLVKHRKMFGGGGIQPDVIVPARDTVNRYFRNVMRSGALNRVVAYFIDEYYSSWRRMYGTADLFVSKFEVTNRMLEELKEQLVKEGIPYDGRGFSSSTEALRHALKVVLSHNIWGAESYYKLYNLYNPVYTEALSVLQKPEQE